MVKPRVLGAGESSRIKVTPGLLDALTRTDGKKKALSDSGGAPSSPVEPRSLTPRTAPSPPARGSRSRPAALARPRALAATATAALTRARTAHQTCRNRPTAATSIPQVFPRNPEESHSPPVSCVMHAPCEQGGGGAHCASVFVRRPSLLEMTALCIYS